MEKSAGAVGMKFICVINIFLPDEGREWALVVSSPFAIGSFECLSLNVEKYDAKTRRFSPET